MKKLIIWTLLCVGGSAYAQTSTLYQSYQVQQGTSVPSYYNVYKTYPVSSTYNMSTYTVVNSQTLKVETYNVSKIGDQYIIQDNTPTPSYEEMRKRLGKTSDLYMNTKRKN